MITRDSTHETPDWQLPPRCCGTWSRGLSCDVCGNWLAIVPANIELGSE